MLRGLSLRTRFLIVDDMSSIRVSVRSFLEKRGFLNIIEAEDGEHAISLLNSIDVDFVISDWNMPKTTGIELLKYVREDEKLKNLPFILFTSENEKSQVLEALQYKVSQYIIKPFNEETFYAKVQQVCDRISKKAG